MPPQPYQPLGNSCECAQNGGQVPERGGSLVVRFRSSPPDRDTTHSPAAARISTCCVPAGSGADASESCVGGTSAASVRLYHLAGWRCCRAGRDVGQTCPGAEYTGCLHDADSGGCLHAAAGVLPGATLSCRSWVGRRHFAADGRGYLYLGKSAWANAHVNAVAVTPACIFLAR